MSIFQWRLDGFSQKFMSVYLYFGHFFENWKNSGLTPGQNDDPVTRTQWPSSMSGVDPRTSDHSIDVGRSLGLGAGSSYWSISASCACAAANQLHFDSAIDRQDRRTDAHPTVTTYYVASSITYSELFNFVANSWCLFCTGPYLSGPGGYGFSPSPKCWEEIFLAM